MDAIFVLSDKERRTIAKFLVRNARKRAKREGTEFTISWEDINIPEVCPIAGIPLRRNIGVQANDSYSLDRLDASKGYVKGNVWVVSLKVNRAKSDLSIAQLEHLLAVMKKGEV